MLRGLQKMKKYASLMFLLFISVFSLRAMATVEIKNGVLQAYWQPNWNADATVNTPELEFRYFALGNKKKDNKIIDIIAKGSEAQKIAFIKKNFKNIPDNFFTFKEWYVNQPGTIKVPAVVNYMECNTDNYKADLQSFQPDNAAQNADDMMTQDFGGCGSATPYLVLYQLKEGEKMLSLKSEASETASDLASVNSNETLAKIRTVDKAWIYVAVYDEAEKGHLSNKRGFVKLSTLTPLN